MLCFSGFRSIASNFIQIVYKLYNFLHNIEQPSLNPDLLLRKHDAFTFTVLFIAGNLYIVFCFYGRKKENVFHAVPGIVL